ncbi:EF-hand domain-containing protein [Sphingomonas flavalba]|uniref:EF-hand domain-containing protein n=1 Tax=Sphingomonas flavalba TaxID=2559804 RepID=UPI0039DF4C3E
MRAGFAGPLLCLLLLAGARQPPAEAVQPPPVPPVDSGITMMAAPVAILITSFDADRDRVVTRAEFDAGVRASFALGDANGDGAISLIELSHWAEAELGSAGALPGRFDFDRNEDDRISEAEFVGEFARRFAAYDKNGDGRLTRDELLTLNFQRPQPGKGKRGR